MDVQIISSPDIRIREIEIPKVITATEYYTTPPLPPPVVVNIGVPIVDVPGCVEVHSTNNSKNNQIKSDDQRGTYTVCDAGIPSYNPINFEPEQIIPTAPAGVNTRKEQPETPPTPELPIPKTPPVAAAIQCPTAAQEAKEPVGTFVEGFRKKVIEYKLLGNECVQITEAVPLPQQIVAGLPSGGSVVQVGGIAVIATSSALLAKPLADILLKAVKPTVKKVMKKIAAIRKKTIPVLSVGERRAEQRQMNYAVRELRSVFPRKKKR